jgi:hypothetical protein
MSTKRTPVEVAAEIGALRALKPVGPWARKTGYTIQQLIEELVHGIDRTADEWDEIPDEVQMAIESAALWKSGDSDEQPSTGWEGLAEN